MSLKPSEKPPSFVPVNGIKPQILKNVCEKKTYTAHFWDGPGPLVICLHGFPDSCLSYHLLLPELVEAGYRVLVPVMPGYEASSVDPEGRYFPTDLAQNLVSWIDRVGEERAHLIGHDWGAVTAWFVAARYPDRLFSMSSIAIPSLPGGLKALLKRPSQFLKSWYMLFFQIRGLAEWSLQAKDGALVKALWRRWSPGWQAPEQLLDAVLESLQSADSRTAVLAYYRCLFNVFDAEHGRAMKALKTRISVPTLMVCGDRDGCIDTRLFEYSLREQDFSAPVELYRIMGAGHFCHLEKPQLFHSKLLSFLDLHPKGARKLAGELARHMG